MKAIFFITSSSFLHRPTEHSLSDFVDIPSVEEGWQPIYFDERGERTLWIHGDSERPGEAWQHLVKERLPLGDIEEVLVASHYSAFSENTHSKIERNVKNNFEGVNVHYVTFSRETDDPVWGRLAKLIFARESVSELSEEISVPDAFDELADAIRKKN